jgi:hypothetical protein
MSIVRGDMPDSQEVLDRLGTGDASEPPALEDFRSELLDLVDTLEELSAELPASYPQLADLQSSLQGERARIRELTDAQLYVLHSAYADFRVLKAGIKSVKSGILTVKGRSSELGKGTDPSLSSFPTIPTPTPVTSSPPGIVHDKKVHDDVNKATGDLFPDTWPSLWDNLAVGCPAEGYPTELIAVFAVAIRISELAEIITEAICKSKTVTCPGTNAQDIVDCIPNAVAKGITLLLQAIKEGFDFCNGNVASARIEAVYHDTEIIHANLYDHDQNLTTRFNWTDKFLFDFRNLNLRLNIEANLASPDDDPHALLALPKSVCISPELEALQLTDPFASEVIAGCGHLELVSDTVRSAIDMTINAGEGVNNAEAEFSAAVESYDDGEWKLAYARFRKAYREAVRP